IPLETRTNSRNASIGHPSGFGSSRTRSFAAAPGYIPRLCGNPEKPLANGRWGDSASPMISPGFLDSESRHDLIELARDGSAEHRLARRANALLLLDRGMSCPSIAAVLFLDGDTVRTWYHLYQQDGIDGLASFGHEGGSCRLTVEQQDRLKAWIAETLPR